jgi:REP element-mobilizing transposase RayT
MDLNKIYYLTVTILRWNNILENDHFKWVIIDSLKYLSEKDKIKVYGFVIMPNHIHLILELLEMNGKESPYASFMKNTAHRFLHILKDMNSDILKNFEVNDQSRKYQFWQRNPMAVPLYSPKFIHQKLDYIHNNPVQGKWMLADSPVKYAFSSASFYDTGIDPFGFLTHIGDAI